MGKLTFADVQLHVLITGAERGTLPRAARADVERSLKQYTRNRQEATEAINRAVRRGRISQSGKFLEVIPLQSPDK